VSARIPASVEVAAGSNYPPEIARTLYLCWLATLEHADGTTRANISVREQDGALAFEVVAGAGGSGADLEVLRDRVEALGGRLTVGSEPGRGTSASGSLPLSR